MYRARDTKLDGNVAITFAPEAFALDAERPIRSAREAKTRALLYLRSIARVHGLQESGGMSALLPR